MLMLQLHEPLDGPGLHIGVDNLVVIAAQDYQVGEAVPLGVALIRIVPRAVGAVSLDVANLCDQNFALRIQKRRAALRIGALIAGDAVQSADG